MKAKVTRQVWLLIFSAIVLCHAANAMIVNDLYIIEAPIADNSAATRSQALTLALDQLLERVSGSNDILTHPDIIAAKQHIDKYINSFSYKPAAVGYNISIQFDDKMIDQLISSAHAVTKLAAPIQTHSQANNSAVAVRITGVNNAAVYARIMACLQNIAAVKQVAVSSLLADEAIFLITADGGIGGIATALSRESLLVADSSSTDLDAGILYYRVGL